MKTLYIDCSMGAAGDMLTAALLELLTEPKEFIKELNELHLPGVVFSAEPRIKCGITGTGMKVTIDGEEESPHDSCHHHGHEHSHDHHHEEHHEHGHDHHHEHRSIKDIEHIVLGHIPVSEKVQNDILAVYKLIAEAESKAHGVPVTEIHFHEVGTMDAIADITAVCLLMDRLSPDEVIASPIHVGSGQVKCAHGILPVPAPATAHILRDLPIYGGDVKGELCTPTGAALIKHFVTGFGSMPPMKIKSIGYGMGKKDFDAANCVRTFLGEGEEKGDTVLELSLNLDDMTAEEISFAMERLLEEGALDVYTVPIGMKKSRPATMLCLMCDEPHKEKMIETVFKYTATIGIRENKLKRYVLDRRVRELDTPYGKVRRKESEGYGVCRRKYEYEDIARIAKEKHMSMQDVVDILKKLDK